MLTTIAQIKKEFFAYRNGIVADALRKGGDPHKFIMGCQLIDVQNIASRIEPSVDMATELWGDTMHRECRMVAPMLYPVDQMDLDTAMSWATSVECNEIADVLCLRLLRRLPFAPQLAERLVASSEAQVRYVGWRLILNLLVVGTSLDTSHIAQLVKNERAAQPARDIAQLLDSIEEDL